jgi:ribosomal-protein-alanine N-acetyltransferase
MLSVNFSPFPVLKTERLILRKTEMTDAPAMFVQRSDPQLMQYVDRKPCESIEEAAAFIRMITDNLDDNSGISWAITTHDSDEMIGSIAIWRIMKEHYRGEVGYVLLPEYQGKGIMHEALGAVIAYGFDVMKLHSLEANTNPNNTPSHKLLERNGFVREAYFKENYYYNGKFLDSAIYSLITPHK